MVEVVAGVINEEEIVVVQNILYNVVCFLIPGCDMS